MCNWHLLYDISHFSLSVSQQVVGVVMKGVMRDKNNVRILANYDNLGAPLPFMILGQQVGGSADQQVDYII